MKSRIRKLMYWVVGMALGWTALTIWVNYSKENKTVTFGEQKDKKVFIFYNPDPIYNLDEQICTAIASKLSDNAIVDIVTPSHLDKAIKKDYDLYIFCSNTYNWEPDWGTVNAINQLNLSAKKAVAITLGSGSTDASHRKLKKCIIEQNGLLIADREYWLLKPNDDQRQEENNVDVALDMAKVFGNELDTTLQKTN